MRNKKLYSATAACFWVVCIVFIAIICYFALIGCKNTNEVIIIEAVGDKIEYGETVHSYNESATLITSKQQLEQFSTIDDYNIIELCRNEEIKKMLNNAMNDGFFDDYVLIGVIQIEGQPIGLSALQNIKIENDQIIVTLRQPTLEEEVDLPCVMTTYCYFIQIEKSKIEDNFTVKTIFTL